MGIQYYKRYRMEIPLRSGSLPEPELPRGYFWTAWEPNLLTRHALTKYQSFAGELDSRVFASLGDLEGCRTLMREIARQSSFLPQATWLISRMHPEQQLLEDCATIQGLGRSSVMGCIQNVGVKPAHRGLGLGRAIVLRALKGFLEAGMERVSLQVTADNTPALELYRSLGFVSQRTLYKAVEVEELTVS